ncbi:L,D-transpeptidase family protein [Sinorhizobium meliloti]|uniref:L,D-transpeptidase family protein n=1 Tax=Rhizobium meliloti TaxID=382 RepID=UPI00129747B7|nr:L,D-transpeptidase family protein [Sinorhizobium meliloti]MDW9375799.1 L,D-transpeptidase family protein [Sinorhizobium meliloti]MDW9494760.1 L,D-transpeptidase family protein [Sinorhizobium meliloti]MDW9562684.1 L,D-transpeptidase family protein [Sinorhizobium meliloti]MDW9650069.1 L,D-transpeptidase family protein [Sinorhizobium meliloti]MDW9860530.1 L,D-transpeptidase family protein [Sinorhizobium meliloti]
MYRRKATAMKTGSLVTPATRTGLSLFAALALMAMELAPANAQDAYGGYWGGGDVMLVTPEGDILDYIPGEAEVHAMRDRRGRTVLVDPWGNIVATVVPNDGYGRGQRRREYGRDGYPEPRDRGYGYSEPGEFTGAIPEYRDIAPAPVEREDLPNSLPSLSDREEAAYDPQYDDPLAQPMPPAMTVTGKSRAEIAALQVFLDREGFSPGVIDGKMGSNVTKAIEAWQQATGETLDPNNTEDILERLRFNGGLPIATYTITAADAAGPFVASIPEDYAHKAQLPHLSFTSVTEMLGEKFHMDEAYLRELNPGVDFSIPGTTIKVVNPGPNKKGKVARIVADKARKQVLAYDEAGKLIAAYPSTIGSSDTPSPSGTVHVERIAFDPGYTYNPKINFQQGANDRILQLQPGPNGPVGTVWIALSKPTYGIHGTPEPSKIGKTQSHGCVRLTNWDATELGKMVSTGVTVEFVD